MVIDTKGGEANGCQDQRRLNGVYYSLAMTRARPEPVKVAWEVVKTFVKNKFKIRKLPRPTQIPHPTQTLNPVRGPIQVLITGVLFSFCVKIKETCECILRWIKIFGFASVLLVFGTAVHVVYKIKNHLNGDGVMNVGGKLSLIIACDAFSHSSTRRALTKFCETSAAEAIIPLCVFEKLMADIRSTCSKNNSMASILMIRDQVRLGLMRLQCTCEEAVWLPMVAKDADYLSYEQRMLNSTSIFNTMKTYATVMIVSNSNMLRAQALSRNLRCIRPDELSKISMVP